MSHASLAARYRPQTFAEVTGQETVKAILSRAAAEDKVAPAYLLSGTRGVGKTTICGMLVEYLCQKKNGPVLAVDADANSNLNEVLGVEIESTLGDIREDYDQVRDLVGVFPEDGMEEVTLESGIRVISLSALFGRSSVVSIGYEYRLF